jgi:hypothetical protein
VSWVNKTYPGLLKEQDGSLMAKRDFQDQYHTGVNHDQSSDSEVSMAERRP